MPGRSPLSPLLHIRMDPKMKQMQARTLHLLQVGGWLVRCSSLVTQHIQYVHMMQQYWFLFFFDKPICSVSTLYGVLKLSKLEKQVFNFWVDKRLLLTMYGFLSSVLCKRANSIKITFVNLIMVSILLKCFTYELGIYRYHDWYHVPTNLSFTLHASVCIFCHRNLRDPTQMVV